MSPSSHIKQNFYCLLASIVYSLLNTKMLIQILAIYPSQCINKKLKLKEIVKNIEQKPSLLLSFTFNCWSRPAKLLVSA